MTDEAQMKPHATISREIADIFCIPTSPCTTIVEPTPHYKAMDAMHTALEALTPDGCLSGCPFKQTRPHSRLCDQVREALELARLADEFAHGGGGR